MRRRLSVLALVGLLVGCVGIGREPDDPATVELRAQIAKTPNNVQLQNELLKSYFKRYGTSKTPSARNATIEQARTVLRLAPSDVRAQAVLYALLVDQAIQERDASVIPELVTLFSAQPALHNIPIPPPSAVDAMVELAHLHKGDSLAAPRMKLLRALQEKPDDITARLILANIYTQENHRELALSMLQQAANLAPDNYRVQLLLGEAYDAQAHAASCAPQQTDDIDRSIKAFRSAVKLEPDKGILHGVLADAYMLRGQEELYLFETRELVRLEPSSPVAQVELADALARTDQVDEAITIYERLLRKNPKYSYAARELARSYLEIGQWQQSRDSWKQFRALTSQPYFYGLILESAAAQLDPHNDNDSRLLSGVNRGLLSMWEQKLLDYERGQISEDSLLADANDVCKQTEAEYYVGLHYYQNGEVQSARTHWQKVVKLRVFAYNEYMQAKYALAHFK